MAVSELSRENPIGRFLENYSNTISDEEKQRRIMERQERNLKSFGGLNAPINQEIPPALNIDKPTDTSAGDRSENQSKLNQLNDINQNIITKQGLQEDNTKLYESPTVSPTVSGGNRLLNNTTGKLFTIAENGSINGGPVPNRSEGRMGGYNLDGTPIIPSGNQGDQDALRKSAPTRQGYVETPNVLAGLLKPGDLPGMSNRALREYNNKILENNNPILKEKNRIDEMNILSQNKLRDIQGETELNPRTKQLDDLYDKKDIYNDLGQVVGQELYNKRTGELKKQAAFPESQSDIIKGLQQMRKSKDPRLAVAEAKYKATFGKLPY